MMTYIFTICVQIIQFRRSAVSNRIDCKYVHIAKHLPFLKSAAFPTRSEFHVISLADNVSRGDVIRILQ